MSTHSTYDTRWTGPMFRYGRMSLSNAEVFREEPWFPGSGGWVRITMDLRVALRLNGQNNRGRMRSRLMNWDFQLLRLRLPKLGANVTANSHWFPWEGNSICMSSRIDDFQNFHKMFLWMSWRRVSTHLQYSVLPQIYPLAPLQFVNKEIRQAKFLLGNCEQFQTRFRRGALSRILHERSEK